MRVFLSALLLPGFLSAAILPDTIGEWHRSSSTQPTLTDRPVWSDYGLKDWQTATYQNGTRKATVSAWQLTDTTGSMAAFAPARSLYGAVDVDRPIPAEFYRAVAEIVHLVQQRKGQWAQRRL